MGEVIRPYIKIAVPGDSGSVGLDSTAAGAGRDGDRSGIGIGGHYLYMLE